MKDIFKNVPMAPQEEMEMLLYQLKATCSESICETMRIVSILESYRLIKLAEILKDEILPKLKMFQASIDADLPKQDTEEESKQESSDTPEETQDKELEEKETEKKVCPECETEVEPDENVCPECKYDFNSEKEDNG